MNNNILENFGLKKEEIEILEFLAEKPESKAVSISKQTKIKRTSLYAYLKNLIILGFVFQSQKNNIKVFSISQKEKIQFLLEQKEKEIKEVESYFTKLFTKEKQKEENPKMQIFEGKKEMQNLSKDFLLYRNTETYSYWPIKSMIEILGEDFFKEFNEERIKRNIWVNAIWPEKEIVDIKKYPFMGYGEDFLREIRIAPKNIEFSMGYWIYENKVAFISSKRSNFGFIIENEEFAKMIKSQFDVVWNISKKINRKLS